METWGIREWGLIIGPLASFGSAVVFMLIKDANLKGKRDAEASSLAKNFDKFQGEIKETIHQLFEKLDKLKDSIGTYPCQQVGILSAHTSQIRSAEQRLDRVERKTEKLEAELFRRTGHAISEQSE